MDPLSSPFLAENKAIDAIVRLQPLVARIHRTDRSLADQIRRAATSVALNLAEANYNAAGNRRSRFETARGSANETRACLRAAHAWGYINRDSASRVDSLYNEILAMTYKLWQQS